MCALQSNSQMLDLDGFVPSGGDSAISSRNGDKCDSVMVIKKEHAQPALPNAVRLFPISCNNSVQVLSSMKEIVVELRPRGNIPRFEREVII